MNNIQIRVDENTKREAKRIFHALGLDMSSAIKIFLAQVRIHRGLPFRIVTENGLTPREEQDILAAAQDAAHEKRVSSTMSPKEALRHLNVL